MPIYVFSGFLLIASMTLAVALVLGGSLWLVLRPSDKRLIGLSVVACVAALAFIPWMRVSSEQTGLYLFFIGYFPVAATITAAVVGSAARLVRTRRWATAPAALLSLAAAGLFYINNTTPWIWPYRT